MEFDLEEHDKPLQTQRELRQDGEWEPGVSNVNRSTVVIKN